MTITLKEIDSRLSTVKTMGRDFNTYIHDTAMMISLHAAPKDASSDASGSGNCTRAVKLVRNMPASMRRTMMILWFETFTPIRIKLSDNGDRCEYDPKYKKLTPEDKLSWWKLEEAAETAFYDLADTVNETDKTYNLAALLEMIKRVSKQITSKIDDGKVAVADLPGANALIAAISAIALPVVKAKADNNDDTEVAVA